MFDVNWCSRYHTPVLEIATPCGLAMTNLIHCCVKSISIYDIQALVGCSIPRSPRHCLPSAHNDVVDDGWVRLGWVVVRAVLGTSRTPSPTGANFTPRTNSIRRADHSDWSGGLTRLPKDTIHQARVCQRRLAARHEFGPGHCPVSFPFVCRGIQRWWRPGGDPFRTWARRFPPAAS